MDNDNADARKMNPGWMIIELHTGFNDGVYPGEHPPRKVFEMLAERHPWGYWVLADVKDYSRAGSIPLGTFHADALRNVPHGLPDLGTAWKYLSGELVEEVSR